MTIVNLQLNDATQQQAMSVLSNMGISLEDAVNLMLSRIAREKKFPFETPSQTPIGNQTEVSLPSNYRLGALPNINVPDEFDEIEVTEFDAV